VAPPPPTQAHEHEKRFTLRNGTDVVLRPVTASDKELLRRGFAELSPESRAARFFAAKTALSDQELRYLTEVDQVDHVAIGALQDHADGERGLGIARCVRDLEDHEVAEAAIAVVDDAQRQGLGTLLLRELSRIAHSQGIRFFHCELLTDNQAMRHLVEDLSPNARFVEQGHGVLGVTVALPEPHELSDSSLHRLLTQVASRAVRIGRFLHLSRARSEPPSD
jgi:GNAT superfamily N-acetyltransferase